MRVTRFDANSAKRVREARFTALDKVLEVARTRDVDFILIAGDLFDDHAVDAEVARRAFLILNSCAVPVYVLPGNHDPLIPGGVWDRPPWNQAGDGKVHLIRKAAPLDIATDVILLPCPLHRKTSMNDPTSWMAEFPTDGSAIRIGLAHGSLRVRSNLPPDDHLIAEQAAQVFELDYLALGHWHRRQLFPDSEGVERTGYCGVHEPMRFQGNPDIRTGWIPYSSAANRDEFLDGGNGEILRVEIRHRGAPPQIQPIEVGHLIWEEEQRELSSEEDLSRLIEEIATRRDLERTLLRLKLLGVLDAATMMRLGELRQVLEGRYALGELDDSAVHLRPTEEEIREAGGQGILRGVLDKLQAEATHQDERQRWIAERATLLLYQIAREVRS